MNIVTANYLGRYCLLLFGLFGCFSISSSQNKHLEQTIALKKTQVQLVDILFQLAEQNITYSYSGIKNAENKLITLNKTYPTLKEVLDAMVRDSKLTYKVVNNHIIIKYRKEKPRIISGFVYAANSGEQLIAANIYNPETFKGTTTNNYGFYSFPTSKKHTKLRYSYIGFEPKEIWINNKCDTVINIYLRPNNTLKEVVIKDNNNSFIKSSHLSDHTLSLNSIESKTMVLGENDVLKTIQLLPGVQPSIEGSTGLQIRGGSHSQNLIIIDDVPIYNVDHSFGFFSIFNASAIKSVQLYKGTFPAKYGGRTSSIIDIKMNEGNNEHLQFDFSTGLILSKFKIEAPILKNKSSFMISARRAHINLPIKILNKNVNSYENYGFSDIYAKINHSISKKHRTYLSLFYGIDKYETRNSNETNSVNVLKKHDSNLGWTNLASAIRWNWLINDVLFCNTTATYSNYYYKHKKKEFEEHINNSQTIVQNLIESNYYSQIRELGFKTDFDLSVNEKHYVKFGLNSSMRLYHPFVEGQLLLVSKVSNNFLSLPTFDLAYDTIMDGKSMKSFDLSVYIEDKIDISNKLKLNLGFRYNSFFYNNKTYYSPEPRISIRYLISHDLFLKAGYSRMSQNTHLLSSSFMVLPFNTWVPSTDIVKPQYSNQYSIAGNYAFKNAFNLSAEAFYNTIENDLLYKSGINNTLTWEQSIDQGIRRSYGMELMLIRQIGKTTGWCTYTLSKTERKFENFNNGEYFSYWLVRKHNISVTINSKINNWMDVSASWVYSSGIKANSNYQRLSPVIFQKSIDYNDPNKDSWTLVKDIPSYHKLDIGINFHKQQRKLNHTLSLGLNNAYARRNPLLISEFEGYLYLSKINLFMPFVQYTLKYK